MTVCPGCYKSFPGQSGFMNHIQQSCNPRCTEVWERMCRLPDDALQVEDSGEEDSGDGGFQDYFGSGYDSDDFPGFENRETPEPAVDKAMNDPDSNVDSDSNSDSGWDWDGSDSDSDSESGSELSDSDSLSQYQAG